MAKSYPTKNDLPARVRREMVVLLNENLATAVHLGLHSKLAHWNVKGPTFYQLHLLFDEVHEKTTQWVDSIGERAVQLGGIAEATLEVVSARTQLPPYELELARPRDHADSLSRSLAIFAKSARAAIDTAADAGDQGTSDLFTEISRQADKMLWFVEAHLLSEEG